MKERGNNVSTDCRRSTRIQDRHNKRGIKTRKKQQTLTLSPPTEEPGSTPGSQVTPAMEAPDLKEAVSQGSKKGVAPKAFLYALQEPPVIGKKIIHVKNVIQIMNTSYLEKD